MVMWYAPKLAPAQKRNGTSPTQGDKRETLNWISFGEN